MSFAVLALGTLCVHFSSFPTTTGGFIALASAGAMLVAVGVQSYVDDGADQNTVLGGFVVATLVLRLLAIKLGPTGPKYSGKGHGVSVYAKAVEPAEPGRTAIYGSVTKLVDHGVTTLYENFQAGCKASGSDPCLGWRPISRDGKDGRTAGDYEWLTYDEVWQRAKNFGSGLEALRLTPPSPEGEAGPEISPSLQFLGTFSRNLPEWVIAEQACNAYGRVLVPLYDTLGHDSVAYVINQTQMKTVVCSPKEVSLLLGLEEECPSLDHIVVMSTADPAEDAEFEEKDSQPWVGGSNGGHSRRSSSRGGRRVRVMHFKHVEDAGAAAPVEPTPPKPDDIATFCYTSGTTGNPKGAMLTHGNITSDMCAVFDQSVYPLKDDVHISYLPLAHMFERIMQAAMFHSGARIGFYQGDTLKLMEDIATLRPTIFPSVPRLYNKIYDKVMTGVAASPVKNLLFTLALNAKSRGLAKGYLRHAVWDKLLGKVGKKVGLDRCRLMITGSAPLSPHVMNWLRLCFSVPVVEGYGQTESAAAATVTMDNDFTIGHVGGPLNCNVIKLEDVPDMGYLGTDTVHGKGAAAIPCRGRGEICFKGPNVFAGYYAMPEKTAEAVDEDGWLHSGDIGIWTDKLALKIVDRKKNIFKLSQGEYVAPEKIENVQQKSPLVAQAFTYGNSMHAQLVSIVVPDKDAALGWAKSNGKGGATIEDLCEDGDFKKAVLDSMAAVCRADKLKGFEIAKAVHLVPDEWTPAGKYLTPTFKKKRNVLQADFQDQIDELYAQWKVAGATGLKQ